MKRIGFAPAPSTLFALSDGTGRGREGQDEAGWGGTGGMGWDETGQHRMGWDGMSVQNGIPFQRHGAERGRCSMPPV